MEANVPMSAQHYSTAGASPPRSVHRSRHRSPNYPMFDLKSAVERAARFYKDLKFNAVDMESAMRSLGYEGIAAGARAIATMLSYGLLEEVKAGSAGRQFRLTQDAYRLAIVLPPEAEERLQLLQQAAVRPSVYSRLVDRFPFLPQIDSPIRTFLLDDMKFNPDAVPDVIRGLRSTYEFAKLGNSAGPASEDPVQHVATDAPGAEAASNEPADSNVGSLEQPTREASLDRPSANDMSVATNTLAIPIAVGRRLLLEAPAIPVRDDIPFLDLLVSYINLMRKQAEGSGGSQEGPTCE